jgi:hypothetical protein
MFNKVDEYLKRYQGITIYAACAMLITLNYGGVVLARKYNETKTVAELFKSPCAKYLRARETEEFRFLGGPPGSICTVEGPLLHLLVDRLLYQEAKLDSCSARC